MGKNACGEWCHRLTSVSGDDSLQSRDRSFQLSFGEESEDSNLRKAAIVDLLDEASFFVGF